MLSLTVLVSAECESGGQIGAAEDVLGLQIGAAENV